MNVVPAQKLILCLCTYLALCNGFNCAVRVCLYHNHMNYVILCIRRVAPRHSLWDDYFWLCAVLGVEFHYYNLHSYFQWPFRHAKIIFYSASTPGEKLTCRVISGADIEFWNFRRQAIIWTNYLMLTYRHLEIVVCQMAAIFGHTVTTTSSEWWYQLRVDQIKVTCSLKLYDHLSINILPFPKGNLILNQVNGMRHCHISTNQLSCDVTVY